MLENNAISVTVTLLLGALGGYLSALFGIRAPWFFGTLALLIAVSAFSRLYRPMKLTMPDALPSLAIGALAFVFGTKFSDKLGVQMIADWASFLVVIGFVFGAQFVGYFCFARFTSLPKTAAWYAATPGGVVESVAQSDLSDDDKDVVMLIQFLRIILILLSLPLAYSIWFGTVQTGAFTIFQNDAPATPLSVILFVGIAALALGAARFVPLPGAQLILPFLAGVGAGFFVAFPGAALSYLLIVVQVLLGSSLAVRFSRISIRQLIYIGKIVLGNCVVLLLVGAFFAVLMVSISERPAWYAALIMSPAGIAEMGIIALGLGADPIGVILHHLIRIFVAIMVLPLVAKRVLRLA